MQAEASQELAALRHQLVDSVSKAMAFHAPLKEELDRQM